MHELIGDVSTVTTISKNSLTNILQKELLCICHGVEEDLNSNQNISSFDIGIGTLHIKVSNDNIQYKFIPSEKLEKSVKETVKTGESPLVSAVEDALTTKVLNIYKDLF